MRAYSLAGYASRLAAVAPGLSVQRACATASSTAVRRCLKVLECYTEGCCLAQVDAGDVLNAGLTSRDAVVDYLVGGTTTSVTKTSDYDGNQAQSCCTIGCASDSLVLLNEDARETAFATHRQDGPRNLVLCGRGRGREA